MINSIEFLLDLLHYIYNYCCGYASCLPQSLCPLADFFVTCCDCDTWLLVIWPFCDSVTVMWCFLCSTLVIKEKKRKGKEILNNDLAILPSHDKMIIEEEETKEENLRVREWIKKDNDKMENMVDPYYKL